MKDFHTKELFVFLFVGLVFLFTQDEAKSSNTATGQPVDNTLQKSENEKNTFGEIARLNKIQAKEPNLPVDITARLKVRELVISGNTLISTKTILKRMPEIYNLSDEPVNKAPSRLLYDFRNVRKLASEPNSGTLDAVKSDGQDITLRTVEGLIQFILSLYQEKHYGGIYVYIPKDAIIQGQGLKDDILRIEVLEIKVSNVSTKFHRADQNEPEKGYLRSSAVKKWSPVKEGEVLNEKKLDEYVNLLNLNPDRHVYSIISKGSEPNTLSLSYDIYEANPWHYFIQVDNSGTHERQWAPRAGIINTNLLGFDDRATVVYQAKPDSTIAENYSIYGSYDIPVWGPKLRLNIIGAHSEFDVIPEGGPFNFLGRGTIYGASLKYNLLQASDWFFDVSGSYSHERSKVTPSIFPSAGSDVEMDIAGIGAELYRNKDNANTSLSLNIFKGIGGSSDERFNLARTNAEPDFTIFMLAAGHSRYIDKGKYNLLRGTVRWITSDTRLVPAKMTSFGGMYTVRGYHEYEIVADGGVLASAQWEFDLLKYLAATESDKPKNEPNEVKKINLEPIKLSPLVFFDYGRAITKDPISTEKENQDLYSVGAGLSFGAGKNFSGACYYGYPLKATEKTDIGDGRVNVSFMLRW